MRRIAVPSGRFVFSICTRESKTKVNGEGLHPTVRSRGWWLERIGRVGTVRQEEALHRIASKRTLGTLADEIKLLEEIGQVMRDASICGLGQTAASVVGSAVTRLKLFEGGAR